FSHEFHELHEDSEFSHELHELHEDSEFSHELHELHEDSEFSHEFHELHEDSEFSHEFHELHEFFTPKFVPAVPVKRTDRRARHFQKCLTRSCELLDQLQ
ncbi:MAG: hypothetical protein ACPLYD_09945, partial [Anaerolineae bacterium]